VALVYGAGSGCQANQLQAKKITNAPSSAPNVHAAPRRHLIMRPPDLGTRGAPQWFGALA
jgi:hypothetical protein